MKKEMLTFKETTEKLNVSEEKLHEMLENGDLYYKIENEQILIPIEQILKKKQVK